jgi:hypothetical protein
MATERQRADLSKRRGQAAAGITDSAARKTFIARQGQEEAKGGKDLTGLEQETSRERNRQAVLGSFKQGGTVPKTGNYKLHKDEKVIPAPQITPDYRSMSARAEGVERGGPARYDKTQMTVGAHMQAEAAGGFRKHGPNDNMVHSRSSAISPHDKDR